MRNNMNNSDRSAKMLILVQGGLNQKEIKLNFCNLYFKGELSGRMT